MMEYTINELFAILSKRKWVIVLLLILFTTGAFTASEFLIKREYTASVSLYVAADKDQTDPYAKMNNLNYAQEVVGTYIVILGTNNFLDKVSSESRLGYSIQELKNMISMNSVNGTEIFEIHVTTHQPRDSFLLVKTIARLAPEKIIEIKNADDVKVVDPPVMPTAPSAPNVLLNTVIGFISGLFLGGMLVLLQEMLDKRIKGEEDFRKHYTVPILGKVPLEKK
jgi:capsular polysaccharide biosynthesis protein